MFLVWRHYTHQTYFPSHPLLFGEHSKVFEITCFVSMLISVLIYYLKPRKQVSLVLIILFLLFFLLDINFLMPFILFYISIWLCIVLEDFGLIQKDLALLLMRMLVVGVYLSSSLQKVGTSFEQIIYPWLIEPSRSYLNISSFKLLTAQVWFIPIWEGLVTLFLLFPKSRKIGLFMAIVIHVVILILYSPLHLNYFGPLFPFNFSLIFFVYYLFKDYQGYLLIDIFNNAKKCVVVCIAIFAFGFPIAYFFGFGHAYLSYDLYSGNYRYSTVYFDKPYFQNLPDTYKKNSIYNSSHHCYSICLDSWLFYETYGTIYRSEGSFNYYKKHFSQFKSRKSHAVFMIYKNGKRVYEVI